MARIYRYDGFKNELGSCHFSVASNRLKHIDVILVKIMISYKNYVSIEPFYFH